MSVSMASRAVDLSRSSWYRERTDRLERDREVIEVLQRLVDQHNRWGFWKCYDRIRLDGHIWNHKRVYRVYRELGLNMRRKTKKRVLTRDPQPLDAPVVPDVIWSLDFMHDTLYSGRRFRTLNILDEGVREALHIEVDTRRCPESVLSGL